MNKIPKLSVRESAIQSGRSEQTIRNLLKSGKLSHEKDHKGEYRIDPEALAALPSLRGKGPKETSLGEAPVGSDTPVGRDTPVSSEAPAGSESSKPENPEPVEEAGERDPGKKDSSSGSTRDRKRKGKNNLNPVLNAKNHMRHLLPLQLLDVSNWINHRIMEHHKQIGETQTN